MEIHGLVVYRVLDRCLSLAKGRLDRLHLRVIFRSTELNFQLCLQRLFGLLHELAAHVIPAGEIGWANGHGHV